MKRSIGYKIMLEIIAILMVAVAIYSIAIKVNACSKWVKDGVYNSVFQCWIID